MTYLRSFLVFVVLSSLGSCQQLSTPATVDRTTADQKRLEFIQWRELHRRATAAKRQGKYEIGLLAAQEAYDLALDNFGPEDPNTLTSLNRLASLYREQGRYDKAEQHYERALALRRQILGRDNSRTLNTMNGLAELYRNDGRYEEAEQLFEEALQFRRQRFGENNTGALTSMNGLAGVYRRQARYGEAETLYLKALPISERVLGERHSRTLSIMHNLASTYRYQGRYDQAEPLYRKTLVLRTDILGERHARTLNTMSGIANLSLRLRRYREAEELYQQTLEGRRDVLGERHPDTLSAMNDLAGLYWTLGRSADAERLYRDALRVQLDVIGGTHPLTLSTMTNLAELYSDHGRSEEAEPLYQQALPRLREALGERHPLTLHARLRSLYPLVLSQETDKVVSELRQMEPDWLGYAEAELATTQSGRVRSSLLERQASLQDAVLSLALHDPGTETIALAGDVVLRWKQIQGSEAAYLAHLLRHETDADVLALANEISRLRARLAHLAQENEPSENPVKVLEKLEASELALARLNGAYQDRQDVRHASLNNLHAVLPEGHGVVEFRQYRPVDFRSGAKREPRFAALLITPGHPPRIADAGSVDVVGKLVDTLRNDQVPARSDDAAVTLYGQLFGQFDEVISQLDKVYIAPDGMLHLVPFDRLKPANDRFWIEAQTLRLLPTGRDLLLQSRSRGKAEGLLALGGVDFDSEGEDASPKTAMAAALDRRVVAETRDQVRSQFEAFQPLEATEGEVAEIAAIYRQKRPDEPVTAWTGAAASEARLKALTGLEAPPRVLHVATHGFYLPQSLHTLARPQLYSGLVMAGANRHLWERRDDIEPDAEDGILYSLEAQDLNLDGSELVVLSACETGQGVIDYSEGIVGLVQALRVAGAQQVMVTLWPVYDRPTSAFMKTFYDNWLSDRSQDPASALAATKKIFLKHENPVYRSPKVWAPFVLVGL